MENVHDKWMVADALDSVVLRTSRGPRRPKNLCLDKGYDYADVEAAVRARRIVPAEDYAQYRDALRAIAAFSKQEVFLTAKGD